MPNFNQLLSSQLSLLLLILLGLALAKVGILDKEAKAKVNRLLQFVFIPVSVFYGIQSGDATPEMWAHLGTIVGLSTGFYLILFVVAKLIYRHKPEEKRAALQHGLLVNNLLYIGLPLLSSFYGQEAILYLSAMLLPLNLAMWGLGLVFFQDKGQKISLVSILKQPVIVSLGLALIFLLLPWDLPAFLDRSLSSLGAVATPLALLIIGSSLTGAKLSDVFSWEILAYCGLRLLVVPLLVHLALLPLGLTPLMHGVLVLCFGMPAAVNTAVIAGIYGKDQAYASRLVTISTLLSMLTLPLVAWLLL